MDIAHIKKQKTAILNRHNYKVKQKGRENNMQYGILVGTVLLEIIIIGGVSLALRIRNKHAGADDFITSGRNLPMIAVAATQALTCIGGGHILGMPGASWSFGMGAFWFIIANVASLILVMCFTGPWVRRFRFSTVSQMFEHMFDKKTSILMAGLSVGALWGVMTLEIQGVGTVISSLSGWNVAFGCIIGGVIALLYVIFGGMKEVGWVNVFNAIFMYVGIFLALAFLGARLPNGWAGVNEFYISSGDGWMLNVLANGNTWRVYIIGTFLAAIFFNPISASCCQASASAKSISGLRKAIIVAAPLNCVFGACMIALGMAAKSVPEFAAIGVPPIATFIMLINLLPGWLVAWLCAAFAAAMLSTIALQVLALSTIFIEDVFVKYHKTEATDKQKLKYVRITVTLCLVAATILSTALPPVESAIVWLFAWLLPAFWLFVFGMYWKRSPNAAFLTFIISGIMNMIWTFSPLPELVRLDGNNNSIGMIIVSFVVCLILTALDKNAKSGFFKVYKEDKNQFILKDAT